MPLSFQETDSGAGALEDLGDVDEVGARLPRLEDLRDPRDRELGAVGRRADLLRDDGRPAVDELDLEVLVLVEALLVRGEVAGELRLRRPLELQADLRRLGRRRRRDARGLAGRRATPVPPAGWPPGWQPGSREPGSPSSPNTQRTARPPRTRARGRASASSCLSSSRGAPTRQGHPHSSTAAAPRVGGTIPNPGPVGNVRVALEGRFGDRSATGAWCAGGSGLVARRSCARG